jgi:hypothetical protein
LAGERKNLLKQSRALSIISGNMKTGLFERIRNAFRREPVLHPLDRHLARRWIKQRLVAVFPQLRNNPAELERAYRNLGMDAQPGQEEGDADTVFVLNAPEQN